MGGFMRFVSAFRFLVAVIVVIYFIFTFTDYSGRAFDRYNNEGVMHQIFWTVQGIFRLAIAYCIWRVLDMTLHQILERMKNN